MLGAEHPDTLRARANLARWTGEAGDAAGARDQFAALLPVQQRVLGAENPYTLRTRANLACWTGEAGDAAAPGTSSPRCCRYEERVLGAEHPRTLRARGNLAHWTGEAGDPAGARDQYVELLPVGAGPRRRAPAHPAHSRPPRPLDRGGGGTGRGPGPVRRAAAGEQRVLGPENPYTLTAPTSPAGPGWQGTRPGPGTSTPSCWPV